MTTSREMLLIGAVVRALRDRGSWAGETHVQKASFVAKYKRHLPLESEFVLYKHGPYSFDLNKSISHMISRGLIRVVTNHGYGPSLTLNEGLWNALSQRLNGVFSRYEADIDYVCDHLAKKNVSELERVATAVYIDHLHHDLDQHEQARLLTELKPHISMEFAREAVKEAANLH